MQGTIFSLRTGKLAGMGVASAESYASASDRDLVLWCAYQQLRHVVFCVLVDLSS